MLIQGGVDITPLITHSFHYTEYEKAFEIMRSGNSGKVILNWTEEENPDHVIKKRKKKCSEK